MAHAHEHFDYQRTVSGKEDKHPAEPVSVLESRKNSVLKPLLQLEENLHVLESRLSPVLRGLDAKEANEGTVAAAQCELDSVFHYLAARVSNVNQIVARLHDKLCL